MPVTLDVNAVFLGSSNQGIKGMKDVPLQRFSIARAFDTRTQYMIADEITSMLDGLTQAQVWREIVDLVRSRNIGLIVISHSEELLDRLCDRRLYLHHGVLTTTPYE